METKCKVQRAQGGKVKAEVKNLDDLNNGNRVIKRNMSRKRWVSALLCVGTERRGVYEFTFSQVPSEHISLTVFCGRGPADKNV